MFLVRLPQQRTATIGKGKLPVTQPHYQSSFFGRGQKLGQPSLRKPGYFAQRGVIARGTVVQVQEQPGSVGGSRVACPQKTVVFQQTGKHPQKVGHLLLGNGDVCRKLCFAYLNS